MVYTFGVYDFDDDTKELRKNGRPAAIEPQPARALALLLQRATRGGTEIVTREELRDAVWGNDTHVDFDRGIAYCISQIRAALGDSGENPRFIQTVPKKGFRFIAPVGPAQGEVVHLPGPRAARPQWLGKAMAAAAIIAALLWSQWPASPPSRVTIAVSVFDNETGNAEFDRRVAGMSDLVVERLTKIAPDRVAVIGNAAILRQPRNIRNLKAVAASLEADYVLLGQLQQGEGGLRFITHFIRLSDEAHLRANRLQDFEQNLDGLEELVVEEFERATREHVLNRPAN